MNEYGCLMVDPSKRQTVQLIEYGKSIVSDSIIYNDSTNEFGRELEPHITVLYGFVNDLTPEQVKALVGGIKNIDATITGVDKFSNPMYDVAIFTIQSHILEELNKKSKTTYKVVNSYPIYHPHLTIAYVKKGMFNFKKTNLNIPLKIETITYSGKDNTGNPKIKFTLPI